MQGSAGEGPCVVIAYKSQRVGVGCGGEAVSRHGVGPIEIGRLCMHSVCALVESVWEVASWCRQRKLVNF